ncbi:MAG: GAF domain-containing protein [Anaerolineae bacterium]|nr:GAF domain-containing protein [Anaerolineae bacterium]
MIQQVWPYIAGIGIGVGLTHVLLLLILFIRRDRDRSQKLAFLYLGLSLLWIAIVALAELEPVFVSVYVDSADLFIPVIATALLVVQTLMGCVFFEMPILAHLAAAGGTWIAIILGTAIYLIFRPVEGVPLLEVALGGWSILGVVMVLQAVIAQRRSRLALQHNRVLYWTLTFIPLMAGQAITLLPNNPLREVGPMVHFFGAIALIRGATSIWLPNVKATLRATLRVLLLTIATAVFLAGIVLASDKATERLDIFLPRTGLIVIFSVLAALVYIPLYRSLWRIVDRWFEGVGFDPAQALRDYSQTIGTLLSSEQLATVTTGTIMELLGIRRGALLVASELERGVIRFQPVPGLGEVTTDPIEMEPISPILGRLSGQREPLFQYEVENQLVLRQASARERQWMQSLEMEIYLPILSQEELVGVLALGSQRGEEPYGPREVEFLTTLTNQTAVALQNARLFEGLQSLNARIIQLNENLRTAYERLERMDQAKSDFLTIASHELRTPLTQIRGYVDVLQELAGMDTLTNDQVLRIANNISNPTLRLENIVNAILDASRIDAEGLSLRFIPTTLTLTIRLSIEPWQKALEERKITLETRGIEEIGTIHVDMERMCQAFGNIISNAIKFTPDGRKITIMAERLDDIHFKVMIADSGIGISKADQELIFEKFYRVGSVSLHSTGVTKFKGAGPGLGLPIARGVVEGHGGCIWVESEGYDEERFPGSTFHIVLPFQAHRGPCRWQRPETVPVLPDEPEVVKEKFSWESLNLDVDL